MYYAAGTAVLAQVKEAGAVLLLHLGLHEIWEG